MKLTRYFLITFFTLTSLGVKTADIVLLNSTGGEEAVKHDKKDEVVLPSGDFVMFKDIKFISRLPKVKGKEILLKEVLKDGAFIVNLFSQGGKYGFEFVDLDKAKLDALYKELDTNRRKLVEGVKSVQKGLEDLQENIKTKLSKEIAKLNTDCKDEIDASKEALKRAFSTRFEMFHENNFLGQLADNANEIVSKVNLLPKVPGAPPPPPPPLMEGMKITRKGAAEVKKTEEKPNTRKVMEKGAVYKKPKKEEQKKMMAELQEALKKPRLKRVEYNRLEDKKENLEKQARSLGAVLKTVEKKVEKSTQRPKTAPARPKTRPGAEKKPTRPKSAPSGVKKKPASKVPSKGVRPKRPTKRRRRY